MDLNIRGNRDWSGIIKVCAKTGCAVKTNENLRDYTTFKIGGTADIIVFPNSAESFGEIVKIIKEYDINYMLLGNGSNVLICENHFDGMAVVTAQMNGVKIEGGHIGADCGVSLNKLAHLAKENSLSGLEFAYGIPGTLGGAVCMNAGAYGGQMSDIIDSSKYLNFETLETGTLNAEQHEFAYRESIYGKNRNLIMLSAVLKLNTGNIAEIESAMNKNMAARREKQPLEYPSAGSVFKRGTGYFASKIIEDCGLKGCSAGGAQVSEKHAGFIINKGGAKFSDVENLIEHIKTAVYEKTGIKLECEIKIWKY